MVKGEARGGPSTIQEVLWVRFPVGAGPSHLVGIRGGGSIEMESLVMNRS